MPSPRAIAVNQSHLCATVARHAGVWRAAFRRATIVGMKTRTAISNSSYRARRVTGEIMLASAITLAAIFVFALSRNETDYASAPPADNTAIPSPQ